MLLKELIKQLQDLYDSYDDGWLEQAGEPEIMIDVFENKEYKGFSPNIEITYSDDGVYPIISAKETWTNGT